MSINNAQEQTHRRTLKIAHVRYFGNSMISLADCVLAPIFFDEVLQKCKAQSLPVNSGRWLSAFAHCCLPKTRKQVEEMKPKSPHAPAKPIRPPERLYEDAEARVIRHYLACCSSSAKYLRSGSSRAKYVRPYKVSHHGNYLEVFDLLDDRRPPSSGIYGQSLLEVYYHPIVKTTAYAGVAAVLLERGGNEKDTKTS